MDNNDNEIPTEKQKLLNELKKLDEKSRLILTLYYYENLNYSDIAQVLNISEVKVATLHQKILETLKSKLD